MLNRFAFRVFMAADTGAIVVPPPVQSGKKPAEPFAIRKGSQAERIVTFLRDNKGKGAEGENLTLEQLAGAFPKSRGDGTMKVTSFESAISKIKTFFEDKGKGDIFNQYLPSDYNAGGQGTRKRKEALDDESLDDLLGAE
jgi:hypothetical protein